MAPPSGRLPAELAMGPRGARSPGARGPARSPGGASGRPRGGEDGPGAGSPLRAGLGRAGLERLAEDYQAACGVLGTLPLESVCRTLAGLARSLEVQRGNRVRCLRLAGLGLQCVDAQALVACLPAAGISELELEGNAISDAGAVALSFTLVPRGCVSQLCLAGNCVGELGALAFERALEAGRPHGLGVDLRQNPDVPKAAMRRLSRIQSGPSPLPTARSLLAKRPASRKSAGGGAKTAAISIAKLVDACATEGMPAPRAQFNDVEVQTPLPEPAPSAAPRGSARAEAADSAVTQGGWRNLFMGLEAIELAEPGAMGARRSGAVSAERAQAVSEIQAGLADIERVMAQGLLKHLRGRVEALEDGLDAFDRHIKTPPTGARPQRK